MANGRREQQSKLTLHAGVRRLEETGESFRAGVSALLEKVGDLNAAAVSARAPSVRVPHDVGLAPNAPVIFGHAPSRVHAAIVGHLHHDHLIRGTGGIEGVQQTVVHALLPCVTSMR